MIRWFYEWPIGARSDRRRRFARAAARRERRVMIEPLESRALLAALINAGTATDVIYTMPAGADTVFLEDDSASGNGMLQLRSGNGLFDTTVFANPTGSLTINCGDPADALTINSLPDFTATLTTSTSNSPFGSITFAGTLALAIDKNLTAFASGTISLPNANSKLAVLGAGSISLTTARNISLSQTISGSSSITSVNGNITLSANQQVAPTSGHFIGIDLNGALVKATGAGAVIMQGKGGDDTGDFQDGVQIRNGAKITGGTGGLQVVGVGGGSGGAVQNNGVDIVGSSTVVSAAGNGPVTVQGTGGPSAGLYNHGIEINGNGAAITSNGGNVQVVGLGMGNADGVKLENAAKISAAGNGTVTVQGTSGNGTAADSIGLFLYQSSIISSGGNIQITGQSRGSGSSNVMDGVLSAYSQITAGGAGSISIQGTAGAGSFNSGVDLGISAAVATTGGGNIQITGIEGTSSTGIKAGTASISTGASGGSITLTGNSIIVYASSSISASSTSSVTFRPYTSGVGINLGQSSDPTGGPLGLTSAELNLVTAGTINIGDASTGAITTSADIARAAATNINITSGGAINLAGGLINTAGGNLTLSPGGAASVVVAKTNTDVNLGATGVLSFAGGTDLAIAINGTTVDTQYQQLNVVGQINLTGVDLLLSGSYTPVVGNSFVIVNNDASDPIAGSFNGLPEGQVFNVSAGSLTGTFQITYHGGDGNDAVLAAVSPNLTLQGTSGDDSLQIVRNGANIDVTLNGTTISSLPVASSAGLIINGLDGTDTLALDLSSGNVIPAGGISFNGGDPTTAPGDKLVIIGGNQGTVTYTFTNGHDGRIVMSNFGSVNYTGLEPVTNNGTATDIIFNLPASASTAVLEDDGTIGNGLSQLRSGNGTFETTTFVNPTGSLAINRGNVADTMLVTAAPDLTSSLTVGSWISPFNSVSYSGSLTLATAKNLTSYAATQSVAATIALTVSGGGAIGITADDFALNNTATLNAAAGVVTIAPLTTGRPVSLGSEVATQLSLTDFELDRIVAGTLRLGDSPFGGPITINAPINVANNLTPIPTLHLLSGGAVVNNSPAPDLTVANLAIETLGGSGSNLTLTTKVATLAASYTGPYGLDLNNVGDLTVTTVDGVSGARSTGGGLTLVNVGSLTISASSGSNPGPTQITAYGANQLLTIDDFVTGQGNATLTADRMSIQSNVNFGTGGVKLITYTSGNAIDLGSTTDAAAGALELSSAELLKFGSPLQIGNANSGPITISADIKQPLSMNLVTGTGVTGSGAITNGFIGAGALTIDQAGDSTYSGLLGGPAGGTASAKNLTLTKLGAGTLTLAGANTYTGDTTISAGAVKFGAVNAIPSGTGKGNVILNPASDAATLDIGGFSPTINGLSNSGAGSSFVDNSIAGGPYLLTIGANNATSTFSGAIKNTAGILSLNKTGSGTLTLSGSNTYSGTTGLNGPLVLLGGSAIPDTSPVGIGTTSVLTLGASETIGQLAGSGTIMASAVATLTVTGGGTYTGTISNGTGTQSLVVNGIGKTLTLGGANTYTGATTISAGKLLVNGSVMSSATVASGATLGGTGTINSANTVAINSGGHLAPGASPGILNSGSLNLASGSNFDVELNGTTVGSQYDQQNVTGTVSLGSATLNVTLGFAPAAGIAFTIVNNDSTDSVSGTFTGLSEGAVFTKTTGSFNGTFQITYRGGDGNDVVLTAVDPANPVLQGTPSDDNWLLTRNGANVDVSLNGVGIWSAGLASLSTATINGLAGNDTLTADLSAGNSIPSGGLFFNGGAQLSTPGDKLVITGGNQGTVTYNYTNAHDGTIVMSNFGTVNYTGLEPIVNSGTTTDVIFNLPAGPNTVTLDDDGIPFNGVSRLRAATLETTDFTDPSGTLTINRGNSADTLTINSLPDFDAGVVLGSSGAPFGSLTFAGTLTLDTDKSLTAFASGTVSLPNATSAVTSSGIGGVSLTTARNISVGTGATITTANGGIVLSANQQPARTSGNFTGISLNGTLTTTGTGNISLTGTAGDDATTASHRGVDIFNGVIRSTASTAGAGKITVTGTGGAGTDHNSGVVISVGDIESVVGDIQITGAGGSGSTTFNRGVAVLNGGQIKSTGVGISAANIMLTGTGGTGSDSNFGIEIFGTGSVVSAVDGDISVAGSASPLATGNVNYGVAVFGSGQILSVGTGVSAGTISITGTGGGTAGANQNIGVRIEGAGTQVGSIDGNIGITGSAESATPNLYTAVSLVTGAAIQITGAGLLSITGTPGTSGSQIGYALRLGSNISVADGSVTLIGDAMLLDAANLTIAAETVVITPKFPGTKISLGGDDDLGTLGLTDAELDTITAGTLQIGDANSGAIAVSANITRAAATVVKLTSGGAIDFSGGRFDTSGGDLTLAPGSAASATFPQSGPDVLAGASGLLSFASGSNLAFAINGTAADTQYDQLQIVGRVDLTGLQLLLPGSYPPAIGDSFVVIENDALDAVVGTFNGLDEGTIFIAGTGNNAAGYKITYQGGDGNDVVLTVLNIAPSFVSGPNVSATDESPPQSIVGWATAISTGPPNEAGQKLTFHVSADPPALFSVQPAIDAGGMLTFTPAPNANGTANITVTLQDDGGTSSAGTDTGEPQTFHITITKPLIWHNAKANLDTTGDDHVAPDDALAIINYINAFDSFLNGKVPALGTTLPNGQTVDYAAPFGYLDVSADDFVSASDALAIINQINGFGPNGEGEPEIVAMAASRLASSTHPLSTAAQFPPDALTTLLALDLASQPKRRR